MTTNIYITLDTTQFDVSFDCPGVMRCKFALCEEMPPVNHDAICAHNQYGSCRSSNAQVSAMESVRRRLAKHIKGIHASEETA